MSQIDAERVLPTTNADGLLWDCEQRYVPCTCLPVLRMTVDRDLLEWPGMVKNPGDDVHVTEKWDVVSRVDSMLRQFCPLLGCIQSACPSHSTCSVTYFTVHQPLATVHDRVLNRNVKPTLNDDALRQRIRKTCNNMCFAVESDEYIVRATIHQNDISARQKQDAAPKELMTKDVISLIELLPDELPCHLAGLCRLSCRDVSPIPGGRTRSKVIKVFAYRSRMFSSVLVSRPNHSDNSSRDPNPPPNSWFSVLF